MASKQIQQLPAAAAAGDTDLLVVSQGGKTRSKALGTLRAEAFADASLPAAPQGGLVGATVRAQLGELDARTAANGNTAAAAQAAATAAQTAASGAASAVGGKVNKAGDAMTGPLTVPDATQPGHAVNKGQLDAESARAQAAEQAAASTASVAQTAASGAQTAASAAQAAASTAQSAASAAQAAASGAVPKAAASTAAPAADVQLYAKDNAGNPLTTLVSNLQSAWLGGANAGEAARTLGGKLRDAVSVRDFGAKGDGVTDDSAAFQAALDAYCAVTVPAGQYLLASEIQVKPRRTITGAGRDTTRIIAQGPRAFTFNLNAGAYTVEPTGTPDWNRSRISQLTVQMATGGVLVHGHEFHAHGVRFVGGSPTGWCVELVDSNECSLREIAAGTGGGGDDLLANGIHFYGSNANPAVNYGDSLIEEVSIKLKSPNTTGILIEHQGDPQGTSYYVVNNVLLNRVQVNSAGVPSGTVGLWLRRVVRAALVNIDVEFLDTAYKVEGVAASGNAGSTRHVSFVNCYVLNCNTPWADSNGTLPGSVMRCFFTNCNGFSPIGAVGVASTDANAHAGEGDTFLPNSLWLTEPNSGQSGVQLRAPNPGQLLLTGDFWDGTSAVRDGNTKNRSPRQALGVDITSFNVTQLYRPRGATSTDLSRLVLGNGETFKPDGTNTAPLHRVEVADPLYLTQWSTQPPGSYGGNTPGLVLNAGSAAVIGSPATGHYVGPGLYALINDSSTATFAGLWAPLAPRPGLGVMQSGKSGTAYTVDRSWFGKASGMANAADSVVTIPAGLIRADEDLASTHKSCARFSVRRGATGRVTFQPGTGVTLYTDGSTATATSVDIPRSGQTVDVLYIRTGASTADVWIVGGFDRAAGTLTGHRQITADTTLASTDLGQIVNASIAAPATITLTIPAAALPSSLDSAFLFLARESDGAVIIAAGTGTTLKTGGKTKVANQYDTVQLLIERTGTSTVNVRAVGNLST